MAQPPDEVLTVADAMKLLKLSRNSVYDAIKRGDLPAVRIGHKIRLGRRAVLAFINGGDLRG